MPPIPNKAASYASHPVGAPGQPLFHNSRLAAGAAEDARGREKPEGERTAVTQAMQRAVHWGFPTEAAAREAPLCSGRVACGVRVLKWHTPRLRSSRRALPKPDSFLLWSTGS